MSSPDTPLLKLEGINKSYERPDGEVLTAVAAVDLTVGHAETVALVGESGSGKSTLGRIALCLIRPDSGRVFLNGTCLTEMSAKQLRTARVPMQPIFQDAGASFNPRLTVLAAMGQALGHRDSANIPARAERLLEDVGLRPGSRFLQRYPHELSGGQRQRLAIARALALEPMLIIADEPLSGADVSIRGQVLNLLADLQRERKVAYLMITHDISVARAFAHRVAVMQRGRVVETGPAAAVLDNPQHAYTRQLVDAVPRLPELSAAKTAVS
jgi:ABC-type glutathione transport system ATPase component